MQKCSQETQTVSQRTRLVIFDREIVDLIFLKLSELFYPYFVSSAVEETSFHHFTEVGHGSSNSFERPI